MSLKKCYFASLALVIVGGIFYMHWAIARFSDSGLIGLLLIGAGVILEVKYFRCPHCGSHLGRIYPWRDSHCPRCGGRIEWEEKQSRRK